MLNNIFCSSGDNCNLILLAKNENLIPIWFEKPCASAFNCLKFLGILYPSIKFLPKISPTLSVTSIASSSLPKVLVTLILFIPPNPNAPVSAPVNATPNLVVVGASSSVNA